MGMDIKITNKSNNADLSRMLLLFEVSNEGLFDMKRDGSVKFFNESFYKNFELDLDHSTFDDWLSLVHPEDKLKLEQAVDDHVTQKLAKYKTQYKVRTIKGNYVWIEAFAIAEYDDDGQMISIIGSHKDISERKIAEDRIYNLAYVDGLTGLYNRSKLDELLIMQISMQQPGALIYLNINQFKLVNDTYGDETGNRVLIRVAERIKQVVNEKCILFRIHADEFVILIDYEIDIAGLERLVYELQSVLEGRVTLKDKVLDITTSVGVCQMPMDVYTPDDLVQRAKLTMRYGRASNKSKCTFFNKSVEKSVMQELHIETGLKSALEADELHLNYQPIVSTNSGEITSFEALVRWTSSKWGEIYPDQFIPVAERTLDIIEAGNFVLEKACLFIKSVREQSGKAIKVSVNVSVVQLVQTNFVDTVIEIVERVGVEPEAIVLEITESLILDTNEDVIDRLGRLDAYGIYIALDDFGTGYSSVNNFITIPMKTLKVDREVMEKAMNNTAINRFITSVVTLCHQMDLKVVAEGIENEEMVNKAKIMKVDFLQGYHYSRPLSEDQARQYIIKNC